MHHTLHTCCTLRLFKRGATSAPGWSSDGARVGAAKPCAASSSPICSIFLRLSRMRCARCASYWLMDAGLGGEGGEAMGNGAVCRRPPRHPPAACRSRMERQRAADTRH